MPTATKYKADTYAQFDFLLSTLRQQLEEAQSTAEALKQHHNSGSLYHERPPSNLGDTVVSFDGVPDSGRKTLESTDTKFDTNLNTNYTLQSDAGRTSIESDDFVSVGCTASKAISAVSFKQAQSPDDIRVTNTAGSQETDNPKQGISNNSIMAGHASLTYIYSDLEDEDHEFHSNAIKLKAFMIAFSTLLLINAGIATLGFQVFDMYHEDQPWRYTATEETWAQKGETKWSQTYKSMLHTMEAADFQKFSCAINYITVLYLGFGSEALVGVFLLNHLEKTVLDQMWIVAQFVFPLFLTMAFQFAGRQNPWSYLFFIVGMWKFCFPETLFYLVKAMSCEKGIIQWCVDIGNGMGTMMHHSACTMLLCLMQAGMIQMNQVALSLITPLILQHLVVLVKYKSLVLYALLSLALEIIWEMEVISILQNTSGCPWFAWAALLSLLGAHWLYWTAAIFQGIGILLKTDEEEEAENESDEVTKMQTGLSSRTTVVRRTTRNLDRSSMDIGSLYVGSSSTSRVSRSRESSKTEEI